MDRCLPAPGFTLTLALALALAGAVAVLPGPAGAAPPARRIAVQHWDRAADLAVGTGSGVVVRDGALTFGTPTGRSDGQERATWTSPWVTPGFTLTELIPSWRALTPGGSSLRVEVRGRTAARTGSWDTMARWAFTDRAVQRRSGTHQTDDLGSVDYDTWVSGGVTSYQVRITMLRPVGSSDRPVVDDVDVMASRLPAVSSVSTSTVGSRPNPALGKVLPVPRYSQMIHRGEYPQYDGGGAAWCSPTATTMVLAYYDALPPARSYSWVRDGDPAPEVVHGARRTYDATLGGTGNWAFNTAYAGGTTAQSFVTRLRNLREAERFIAAGIPVIASLVYGSGELTGSPIGSSNGHLMVIVGFRDNGDVVVNDPAASSDAGVRRTYDRGQFEDAWLKRYPSNGSLRGSGGLAYVIRDADHRLPDRGGNRNW